IFAFDNATSHIAFAEDVLVASKMNLGPGERGAPIDNYREYYFVYVKKTNSCINLHGKPKGIKWVLTERECISCKESSDSDIIDCCACRLMANQPDFLSQRGQIQQEIEFRGHKHRQTIIEAFDSISIEKIRSFARLSFRWMDAYRCGLTGKAAEYAVKQYKKHRSISKSINEEIINQINMI
ncbi:383_t:CDS:2, partial [Gigaspora margarita]